jgi:maltose alpha-D-glucosyltransferase / alpha-amylase
MNRPAAPRNGLTSAPHWYKDAVIYECRTRSFFDSNGDGVGDLAGLAEKLPYLQDLGITAVWLLPLMPSPMRDDGYDIADYFDVDHEVGTREDFRDFVSAAHRHGIRVITELVLNHTSDAHPWFQRARRAPPGSSERNFYVWTDAPEQYRDARIIFKDFEPSNWSWDRVAGQYYWHRFFSHQPDLNFENPAVQAALFEVVDFWFELGVDGLRLDAVPYLYEREGTNCENLPETHAFLKRLRAHVDSKFENRMLLAEANQWPEDAAAYFGDGDECHMNFHFPIMPRMFMAIHMEDRFPIIDIMEQTPQLHANCQWAMFLRNHDELTLEMVTDEERDYMYRAYAHESSMRINLGIRRRLAPLVGNDRRKVELLNGLLFSLPGTPVLYYGDEIGMGDNVYLGDRNGVRTPMQWSSDRNAGFSRSNPQRLILPVIIDPEYHFESLNVEAQQNNPNSLLWWTKRLIALRKRYHAFGRGTIEFLSPSNPRVLAFIREYNDERILVVANLSRFVQYVELDLSKYKGMIPIELFGRNAFPAIGELSYLLTLGGHSFYWCSLEQQPSYEQTARASLFEPPTVECSSFTALCSGSERALLEELLPEYLSSRSWFAGQQRTMQRVSIQNSLQATPARDGMCVLLVRVEYTEGESETYVIPLAFVPDGGEHRIRNPFSVLAALKTQQGDGKLVDAIEEYEMSRPLLQVVIDNARFGSSSNELMGSSTLEPSEREPLGEPRAVEGMRSNAALQFGDRFMLKVFRRMEEGVSPDLELGRFLATRAPGLTPRVIGALEYRSSRFDASTLAILQSYVPNEGTAWSHARRELGRFFERVLTRHHDERPPELPATSIVVLSDIEPPPIVRDDIGFYQQYAALLGKRTAEMHLALASSEDPAFAPEAYSSFDRRSAYQSRRNLVGRVLRTMRAKQHALPPGALELARVVLAAERAILACFEPLLHQGVDALRIRVHGDFHLDQALWTGKDFVLIDFDGGHDTALSERRRKRSALRDVAGMIRSFHYAAYTGLYEGIVRDSDRARAQPWADAWHAWISATFMHSYRETAGAAVFLPRQREDLAKLLDMSILSKAFVELGHELVKPGAHVMIPLIGIAQIMGVLREDSLAP